VTVAGGAPVAYHRACVGRCATCDMDLGTLGGSAGMPQVIGSAAFCPAHAPASPCAKCGEDTAAGGPYIVALGKRFCRGCFDCATCGSPITNGQYLQVGERAFCAACGAPPAATCARATCGKPITGRFLKVTVADEQRAYHEECFSCMHEGCDTKFTSGFFTRDGQPVCEEHRK
jgi:hypothetical protein